MNGLTLFFTLTSTLQVGTDPAPLPADPPIGGPIWTLVIPAALFLGSFLGTYLLYKKFSKVEVGE